MAEATLVDCLVRAERHRGVGLRFVDRSPDPVWLPWPRVVRRARAAAGRLVARGVRPGDRVALVFPTTPDFLDAFFGVVLTGGVPVPLYPPLHLGRLADYRERTVAMLQAADVCFVLADRRVQRVLGEVVQRARPALGCSAVTDLPAAAPAGWPDVAAADLALVQFSSGTTRDPRPVALSHRALLAQATLLNRLWPDSDGVGHSGVSWLPLYHDMGLIGSLLVALERPGTLTLIPPEMFVARPAVWLRTISTWRATISPAPNFAYSLAAARIRDEEMDGVDLSCWQVALNGAEIVVPDVMRAFARRFARWGFRAEALTPAYGLAEAALAVTLTDPSRLFVSGWFDTRALAERGEAVAVEERAAGGRELASAGVPVPGFDVKVVDGGGRRCREGQVGAIVCRGPSLMEGYFGQPDATVSVLRDGWLKTGDLGFLWRGELYLTGRAKDVLILRGRNHAPEEVERALDAVPGVRVGCGIAVSWLPEGAETEVLVVFVEARRDVVPADLRELSRACAASVLAATGLAAERVVVLLPGTLPRTSSGKLRRQEALHRYLAGELRPPDPVTPLRLAGAVARSTLGWLRFRLRRWKPGRRDEG